MLGLLGGPTIQEFTPENRFQNNPAVISSTSTIFRCLEKKIQNIAMCSSSYLSLSHKTQPRNNRNIPLYCVSLITPRTSCVMTCLYVATITHAHTTQWSVIGHAEGWHFLIPAVQLRFNDFHCLELRGGSGEVMQRGLCHLNYNSAFVE